MTTYRFPDGFLWGAATSAYQIEGSPLADGAGPSIQHRFSHTPGNVPPGHTGDVAADHYNRYREDVALMRELGMPNYQFSISWPRVMPDGDGAVNAGGLDFYDRLVDELLEAGIGVVPILHVWDLPAALQDRGGWANRDSAEWFGEYAAVVFERIGDRASHWLTICESYVVAHDGYVSGEVAPCQRDLYAGLRAAHNVLLGHGRAVQAFRASGASGEIGTSTMVVDVQPATDAVADVAAADRLNAYMNALFLDPIMLGEYPAGLAERFGEAWPSIADGDLATISTPIDFLGYTYYLGTTVADAATAPAREKEPTAQELMLDLRMAWGDGPQTGLGWTAHPEGAYNTLTWLRDRYGNPPIVVTENGAAFPDAIAADGTIDDPERIGYIRDHLAAAHRAIEDGVDLRGWFVWSFLDTWEFALGYTGRFGIVHVDYVTQQRTVKSSGRWLRELWAANGFDA